MTPSDTAIAEQPIAETPATAGDTPNPPTAEDRAKQFQLFMTKVMTDMSRLRVQADYVARHFHGEVGELHSRCDHIEGVLAMICDALHIEMPKRAPKLVDAKVELTAALNKGEVCEMRASYSSTPHPIFGNIQIILGGEDDAQQAKLEQFHPIVVEKLTAAFDALRQSEGFVDGQFYYVRLGLIHAKPIDATSVPYAGDAPAVDAAAPAANDDATPAVAETADVQPE